MIAVDTNVLVYAIAQDDPHHAASRRLLDAVAAGLMPACVFPQNLLEFYAVATNSRRMAPPLTATQALTEIRNLRAIFPVVMPKESSLDCLLELAASAPTMAADIFDAFIAAQMVDAGINAVCTHNARDFAGFSVSAMTPEEIMDSLETSQGGSRIVQDRPRR